jgi:hypothetical protein
MSGKTYGSFEVPFNPAPHNAARMPAHFEIRHTLTSLQDHIGIGYGDDAMVPGYRLRTSRTAKRIAAETRRDRTD